MKSVDEIFHEVRHLRANGRHDEVESVLLDAHSAFTESKSKSDLRYVVLELASYYSVRALKSINAADQYYKAAEGLDEGLIPQMSAAAFYLCAGNYPKVIEIANGVEKPERDPFCFYSILAIKGRAALRIKNFKDALEALEKLTAMVNEKELEVPYGDEIGFIGEALDVEPLHGAASELLRIVVPRIIDEKYRALGESMLAKRNG